MGLTAEEVLEAIGSGEALDWEFKSAAGGLPGSLWETYSAMANTEGGLIVLGVSEQNGGWIPSGVGDTARLQADLWNLLNNPQKVSLNLLSDRDVTVHEVGGATLIVLRIPRANRRQRPIYLSNNPVTGTYRRNFDGDYRCRPEEVERMLGDRQEEGFDARILKGFGWNDLDRESIAQYRNLFRSRSPDHPWHVKSDQELIGLLGGWRRDRETGDEGLTVAGLLMFGRDETIRDPHGAPGYYVDYREKLSEGKEPRWDDRITLDGTWAGNLFLFYQRVIGRLTRDLSVPFATKNLIRVDDTPVHEALREALTNAMIHADYRGAGGIVVWRRRDGFEFSNPGTLLISLQQLKRGGVSECRNKNLQKMFQFMGRGERAGSGVEAILKGWQSQHWTVPDFEESANPDRVSVRMPTVSLIPPGVPERLERLLGIRIGDLRPLERQALITAAVEGRVSNGRLQLLTNEHPADITKSLSGLVARNCLISKSQKRWAYYVLPGETEPSLWSSGDSLGTSSQDNGRSSQDSGGSSQGIEPEAPPLGKELLNRLRSLALPKGERKRLHPDEMRNAIRVVCAEQPLTAAQLGQILDRSPVYLQQSVLSRMVANGEIGLLYPGNPTHPQQAYRTVRKDATA